VSDARLVWDLLRQPRGRVYAALVEAAGEACPTALLVTRPRMGSSAELLDVLARLEPHLVRREERNEWPGTRLIDGTATVHEYRVGGDVLSILRSSVKGLYLWRQPARPEDLCFLRADGTTWLGSIAHERDAWLELDEAEAAALVARVPHLALRRRAPGA
jgi:hypothetical protein